MQNITQSKLYQKNLNICNSKNWQLLSYDDVKKISHIQCNRHHLFTKSARYLHKNSTSLRCREDDRIDTAVKVATNKEGQLIRIISKYRGEWKCIKNHTFLRNFTVIVDEDFYCYLCDYPERENTNMNRKYTYEEVEQYVIKMGGILHTPKSEYKNCKTLLSMSCKDNHKFELPFSVMVEHNRCCKSCGTYLRKYEIYKRAKRTIAQLNDIIDEIPEYDLKLARQEKLIKDNQ